MLNREFMRKEAYKILVVTLLIVIASVGFTTILVAGEILPQGTSGIVFDSNSRHATVEIYDDGSIRVYQRAGDTYCIENGRAVDCFRRGLKKR